MQTNSLVYPILAQDANNRLTCTYQELTYYASKALDLAFRRLY